MEGKKSKEEKNKEWKNSNFIVSTIYVRKRPRIFPFPVNHFLHYFATQFPVRMDGQKRGSPAEVVDNDIKLVRPGN